MIVASGVDEPIVPWRDVTMLKHVRILVWEIDDLVRMVCVWRLSGSRVAANADGGGWIGQLRHHCGGDIT
jgi:hypothetical protein